MSVIPGGGHQRSWTLIEGSYHRNTGAWRVLPWPGEVDWTLLVYQVDINPKMSVPDFILKEAQTGALPDVFKQVVERAQKGAMKSKDTVRK